MKKRLVVDLGHNSFKCVVVPLKSSSNAQPMHVLHQSEVKDVLPFFDQGKVLDLHLFVEALKHHIKEEKLNLHEISFIVNSQFVITRELTFPTIKNNEIENSVYLEAPNHFPVDLKEYIVQYRVVSKVKLEYEKISKVQVTAVPRDLIENLIKTAHLLKLKPGFVDISDNAMSKYALLKGEGIKKKSAGLSFLPAKKKETLEEELNFDDQKVIGILDFGYKTLNYTILQGETQLASRNFDQGAFHLFEYIAERFDKTPEQAEQVVKQYGTLLPKAMDNPVLSEVNQSIHDFMNSVIEDINRINRVHSSKENSHDIETIYYFGGVTHMEGFGRFFSDGIGIPCEDIDLHVGDKIKSSQTIHPIYTVAVTGALRRR